jgi:hypothetical protein
VPYESDFEAGEEVVGVAYDWGGMDGPQEFERKLALGQAAGSHMKHGSTNCTAGVDCSGLVSLSWRQRRKFATSTIDAIAVRPAYDLFTDLKPGDVLNKAGSHIVLFVSYRADGNPTFYEASGRANRVILNDWSSWSYLKGYYPLQYKGVTEGQDPAS